MLKNIFKRNKDKDWLEQDNFLSDEDEDDWNNSNLWACTPLTPAELAMKPTLEDREKLKDKTVKYYEITLAVGTPDNQEVAHKVCLLAFDKPTPEEVDEFWEKFEDELHMLANHTFDFISNIREMDDKYAHANYILIKEQITPIFARGFTRRLTMAGLNRKPDSEVYRYYDMPNYF